MTTGRPASYNAISTYSRVEILHLLQTHPQQTIGELVTATGLHANTVRGRPRVFYRAVDGASVSSDEHRRKVQAARERGDLMRRVMPSTEGTLVPEEQHQLYALVEQLLDGGFEPVVDEDTLQIDLAQCDHAEAQASHTKTLCDVHLGLMRGALREAGGPLAVDAERSSCDPRDCVIRLMRRTPEGT